jgi:protein-L-isoaspartate(D-aspartate) O-methyltransferase
MDAVEYAIRSIDRANFMPENIRDKAMLDAAQPIGYGQTISQPYTVKLMLHWLKAEPGNRALDVGSGSGWTTALLSYIVGNTGLVYAVEIVPELVKFGRENCARVGVQNAYFFQAGKEYGLPKYAPFDRILVSASAQEVPEVLLEQLRIGGKMVIPVRHDILEITKLGNASYDTETHGGFVFVPLV